MNSLEPVAQRDARRGTDGGRAHHFARGDSRRRHGLARNRGRREAPGSPVHERGSISARHVGSHRGNGGDRRRRVDAGCPHVGAAVAPESPRQPHRLGGGCGQLHRRHAVRPEPAPAGHERGHARREPREAVREKAGDHGAPGPGLLAGVAYPQLLEKRGTSHHDIVDCRRHRKSVEPRSSARVVAVQPLLHAGLERLASGAGLRIVDDDRADLVLSCTNDLVDARPGDVTVIADELVVTCRGNPNAARVGRRARAHRPCARRLTVDRTARATSRARRGRAPTRRPPRRFRRARRVRARRGAVRGRSAYRVRSRRPGDGR